MLRRKVSAAGSVTQALKRDGQKVPIEDNLPIAVPNAGDRLQVPEMFPPMVGQSTCGGLPVTPIF